MSIGGIDGVGRGGRGFIPPAGGGGGPPPPGGPNGPGDDGDDRKKVSGSKDNTDSLRTVPEMIRALHDAHCGKGRYVDPMTEGRRLPSVETLQWLGDQEGLSDDDRRMLGELRERVVQEEARMVHLERKTIDDVQEGIRDDVAAALAGIAAYLASLPPEPVNPPLERDDTVQGAGDAGGSGMHSGDGHRGGGSAKQQSEKPDTGEDEDAEPEAGT